MAPLCDAVLNVDKLVMAGRQPQKLTQELASGAALLVTMGCGEKCPYVPGLTILDWPLEDPKGKSIEQVRGIFQSNAQLRTD